MLPSTGAKGAWLVAERLRARIAEIPHGGRGGAQRELRRGELPGARPERDRARARGRHGHVLGQGDRAQPQRPLQPRPGAGAHREHPPRPGEQRGLPGLRARARRRDGRPRPLAPTPTPPRWRSTPPRSRPASASTATASRRSGSRGCCTTSARSGCSDAVLHKPGRLTDPESAEMRRHPEIGAKLLVHPGVAEVRGWVLQHHERPDGRGYPFGLRRRRDPPGGPHPRGRRRLRGHDRRPPLPAQPGPPRPPGASSRAAVAPSSTSACSTRSWPTWIVRAPRDGIRPPSRDWAARPAISPALAAPHHASGACDLDLRRAHRLPYSGRLLGTFFRGHGGDPDARRDTPGRVVEDHRAGDRRGSARSTSSTRARPRSWASSSWTRAPTPWPSSTGATAAARG